MMTFSSAYLAIFILSSIPIRPVHLDPHPFLPSINQRAEYAENEIEDYVPHSDPNEVPEYDWSPPKGQVPDPNEIEGPPLGGDDDDYVIQDFMRQWIGENNRVADDVLKNELKRGFDFPKKKKNQVLCRVQKAIHRHSEAGHEFFPKSFTSYMCHPVSPSQMEGTSTFGHDVCLVRSNSCTTLYMKRFFLKRNLTNVCWSDIVSTEVESGCDCLYHYKYRIHK